MRTGHFVGDPTDERNRVGSDGLTEHQRNYLHEHGREAERLHANRFAGIWTSKYINGRWWSREEWEAAKKAEPQRPPELPTFKPAWYPHIRPGGMWIESAAELKAALKTYGKEQRY